MKRVGEFLINQASKVLENKQYAIMLAVLLSVLPFASWLSVSLVALITMRRGKLAGFEVLLPALVMHSVPLMLMLPVDSALINTCLTYLPCYFAALILRKTGNWQWVSGVFLVQALVGSLLIQAFAPEIIMDQFNQFKTLLSQYQEYQQLVANSNSGMSTFLMAQLFFSIQVLSIIVSACISLLFARSIQARLYVPGGFTRELLAFRSGKIALLPLLLVAVAAYYQNPVAINLLPLVLVYFLLSGFNLVYFLLARKRQIRVATLLVLLVLIKPSFVLSAYIVLGSLDSVFNFRVFLPQKLKESI